MLVVRKLSTILTPTIRQKIFFIVAMSTESNEMTHDGNFKELRSLYNADSETEKLSKIEKYSERMTAKLHQIEACFKCIDKSEESRPETKRKCRELMDHFQQFLSTQNKNVYNQGADLRTLFLILQAYYQDGREQKWTEGALIGGIESIIDSLPGITPVKKHCLVGALLLADGHSLKFYDYLKVQKVTLDHDHVLMLCRIAHFTHNANILEPIVEMPDFLMVRTRGTDPKKQFCGNYAKLFEQLSLIYGKQDRLDRLEWLWRKLFEMERIRKEERRIHFRHGLRRIAHFYRKLNQKLPIELEIELKRMDDNSLFVFYPEKRKQLNQPDGHDE